MAEMVRALCAFLGMNDMMAYLTIMANPASISHFTFHIDTMRLGKKSGARMLVEICAPVAQMDQSGRFLNGKSRFDSGREHHFFQPNFHRIPSLKSDTASDTILSF